MKILFFFISILFSSCYTINDAFQSFKYKRTEITDILPAGTIKISNNLFIDETETSNYSYDSFLWYTKRMYGDTSVEYESMLPTFNKKDFYNYFKLGDEGYYLFLPDYKHNPVINISYHQALEYGKWRSNRVMEYILIMKKMIKYNFNPIKETEFTIEKYFTGNYYHLKPDKSITDYPFYELPDSITFLKALRFADSLNKMNINCCNNNQCTKSLLTLNCLENYLSKTDTTILHPTEKTYCDHYVFRGNFKDDCKKPIVTHLLGNVREMTCIPSLTFGGSYIDSCNTINKSYFYTDSVPNYHTGLRMMCRYKKWTN